MADLARWLISAAAEETAATTRDQALKSAKIVLTAASAASELRKGTFLVAVPVEDGTATAASLPTDAVGWDWVLVHAVNIAQRLISGLASAPAAERRGRTGVRLTAVQLAIDILVVAVRETATLPSAENIGRAKLLPHLPAILQICESFSWKVTYIRLSVH